MKYITQKDIGGGGRLGNQMFGIAALYGTAKRLGYMPILNNWFYSKYFKDQLPNLNRYPTAVYNEPYFHYTEIDLQEVMYANQGDDLVLNLSGYYQSERYFNHCKEDIKELFKPTDKINWDLGFNKFGEIGNYHGDGAICAIHIRRGDYVGNNYYADIFSGGYYSRAIEYMKSQKKIQKFLIFSDDINWCSENFKGDNFHYVSGNSDIEDLFLMTYCDHFIIANSSFSWWGAWLSENRIIRPVSGPESRHEKLVIAPKKWFGANTVLDTKDLIPAEWVRL